MPTSDPEAEGGARRPGSADAEVIELATRIFDLARRRETETLASM